MRKVKGKEKFLA